MQHQVHGAEPCGILDQLPAGKGRVLEGFQLIPGEVGIVLDDVVMGGQQKAAGAASRVTDGLTRFGPDHIDHGLDQRARREILPGPGLGILGVLFQ